MSKWRILEAVVGTTLLVYHFWLNGFHLNLWGVVLYVLIWFVVAFTVVLGKVILKYYQKEPLSKQKVETKNYKEWFKFLLPMASTGIFVLPLVYLGITPLWAIVFAFVSALPIQSKNFELGMFITWVLARFLTLFLVLPMGIEAIMIGAGANNLIAVSLGAAVNKAEAVIKNKLPPSEVKGKRLVKGRRT